MDQVLYFKKNLMTFRKPAEITALLVCKDRKGGRVAPGDYGSSYDYYRTAGDLLESSLSELQLS